jgi:hypothetical protein
MVGMIIQLCEAYCNVFPPYDFTLVLEPDCTFERAFQPSPGDPVCSDIFNCRRSLIKISLTVFTQIFYKYRTVRLNLVSVPMLLILLIFIPFYANSKRLTIVYQDQRAFRLHGADYSG